MIVEKTHILSPTFRTKLISDYLCSSSIGNHRLKLFRSILIISLLSLSSLTAYSQDPTYFVLGEEELLNTDIYSICQTENELVYLGTNHGLFVYLHGKFERIPGAEEQRGNSLFELKLDNNGELYCANLGGQTFKLENGKLKLVFELEKGKNWGIVMYEFDDQNRLIVASKESILEVDNNGKSKIIYTDKQKVLTLNKLFDGRLIVRTSSLDSMILIEHGILRTQSISVAIDDADYNPFMNHVFELNGKLINFFGNGKIQLLEQGSINNHVTPLINERYFQYSKDVVWAMGTAKGVRKITLNGDSELISEETMYVDRFISAIHVGENGTLFFGTFGNGLLVVPNQATKKHIIRTGQTTINGIAVDAKNNVFLSTRGGKVIHYDGKERIIDSMYGKSIHKIYYANGIDFGKNKLFPSLVYTNSRTANDIGSVKDICQVDDKTVLIATSIGIYKKGLVLEGARWDKVRYEHLMRLGRLNERCIAVSYDKQKNILYVGTSTGLFELNNSDEQKEIRYKDKSIICQDLLMKENELWCATSDHGILVFKNSKVVRKIDKQKGLSDLSVNKIELRNNQLFVAHNNGIQILNLETNVWITLGTAEGIINGSVADFALSADKLWILSDGQPISLMLDNLPQKTPTLNISLDSVLVLNKRVLNTGHSQFSYTENQFSFFVNFNGVEYESESVIYYRIKGFDKAWKMMPATEHIIEYDYLPPGDYELEVKVKYRETESEVTRFAFEINPPYWQTVWFYVLISVGIGLFLVILYFYQIRRVNQRNKEKLEKQQIQTDLLDSELKALRSQMNPHFIFNSLNSIQDLILQQETDASYDYIVLFADLVRSTLNYSGQDFIPIEKEIKFLEVYLSLEKLRFEEDFNYSINYDGPDGIDVPSLFIQPFIENALVHGLLHKTGQKNLTIDFELTDKLICTITDDGVGRKRSKEIQERRGNHHESFALDAIDKRLSILSAQYGKEVGYEIHDLYNGEESIGTKVVITMPYLKQF